MNTAKTVTWRYQHRRSQGSSPPPSQLVRSSWMVKHRGWLRNLRRNIYETNRWCCVVARDVSLINQSVLQMPNLERLSFAVLWCRGRLSLRCLWGSSRASTGRCRSERWGKSPSSLLCLGKWKKRRRENQDKEICSSRPVDRGSHLVCLQALSCFISVRTGWWKWTAGAEVERTVAKTHSIRPFLALPLLLSLQQFHTRVTRRREMWIRIEGCHSYYRSTSFTAFKTFHHGDNESLNCELTQVQGGFVRDTKTQ